MGEEISIMRVMETRTNGKATETGKLMHRMVDMYYRDMMPYASFDIDEIFNIVKDIPYNPDPEDAETLMRPMYTMNSIGTGGDCDDKAIALASYAKINRIPYRFVAVRAHGKPDLHHVFVEFYKPIMGGWFPMDATYSVNTLGITNDYAERVVI